MTGRKWTAEEKPAIVLEGIVVAESSTSTSISRGLTTRSAVKIKVSRNLPLSAYDVEQANRTGGWIPARARFAGLAGMTNADLRVVALFATLMAYGTASILDGVGCETLETANFKVRGASEKAHTSEG